MQVVQLIELIISLKILLFCSLFGVRMGPTYFPLRWESSGDQWWYASPIDWAAANGHFDLVRELLRIDNNHLIKLTSLRRIRRLESVWDDEELFDDVAKCRSQVARKLFQECESKKSNNSLIQSGYGGWLMYTAASAGDLSFIQLLLDRNPLLVFGEGEYGVTDILHAAARSKNSQVFRIVYDFSVSPRFLTPKGGGGEFEEHIGDIPSLYKSEMVNRAVHAAARAGNLTILRELLRNCSHLLSYRDKQGSTILHAAAAKGQLQIVRDVIAGDFDMIKSRDHQGNTALHIGAYRGQSSVVEALIETCPSLVSSRNNAGETFLHMAVSGLQSPAFKRLDRHIELMRRLISGKNFNMEEIINAKNNQGRTALHAAILGNVHCDLVQLLMSAPSINVNARDADGLTPLDLLKQGPHSPSSDILIRRLISAGATFGDCREDYTARRAIASCLKMQASGGISPGTSFRISDAEIFLYTGVEIPSGTQGRTSSSTEYLDLTKENQSSRANNKKSGLQQFKKALLWPPRMKGNKPEEEEMFRKSVDQGSVESKCNTSSEETPTPLRLRFMKPLNLPLPNNKRTLAVRSNQSSPKAKKKFASGIMHGVMQAIPRRSRSSSFSKSSISSPTSMEKQKDIAAVPSPSFNQSFEEVVIEKERSSSSMNNKRLRSQYFCFGGSSLSVKTPVSRPRQSHSSNPSSVISVA